MSTIFLQGFRRFAQDRRQTNELGELSGERQWRQFESLIKDCLRALGHHVVERVDDSSSSAAMSGCQRRIYAHLTKRDVAGDLFYKQMHLPELFSLDEEGWGADHSAFRQRPDFESIDDESAARFCRSLNEQWRATGTSKHPQPQQDAELALPEDFIFVPLQRPADYVQIHHSPISIVDFLTAIARWAEQRQHHVVFKLHPGNARDPEVRQCAEHIDAESQFVQCVNANVHDLISRSKGVITINSGVGFESLIHGKPVVTFGDCDYKWVTFRADTNTLDEARVYLREHSENERMAAWKFVYFYCFNVGYFLSESMVPSCRRRLIDYLGARLGTGEDGND